MTKQEKDYAVDRIDKAIDWKRIEIKGRHSLPAISLTEDQKLDMIYGGVTPPLTERTKVEGKYRISFDDIFDFSEHERFATEDANAIYKEWKPIQEEAQRLKDEIMLGSAPEALKLMREFFEKLERNR